MAKLGILGGTFDPPHVGHLILGQQAAEQLQLDKVFFIPANNPPHKNGAFLDSKFRLEMVRLAVEGNSKFEALGIEIKRRGPSYTIDTVAELKKIYPNDEFYLIVGSDLAGNFNHWRHPDRIKKEAKVVVAQREGAVLETKNEFKKINITQVGISSSQIRERVKKSKAIRYLVSEKVRRYIKDNNFYL